MKFRKIIIIAITVVVLILIISIVNQISVNHLDKTTPEYGIAQYVQTYGVSSQAKINYNIDKNKLYAFIDDPHGSSYGVIGVQNNEGVYDLNLDASYDSTLIIPDSTEYIQSIILYEANGEYLFLFRTSNEFQDVTNLSISDNNGVELEKMESEDKTVAAFFYCVDSLSSDFKFVCNYNGLEETVIDINDI